MSEEKFDRPIYKVLARNDTGQAPGHQGGMVIPKDLEGFFPLLSRRTDAQNPTVGHTITADLFDESRFLETVETRYQYQTWGGERPPERRITGNLTALRNIAGQDDILIIERGIDDDDHYRFTLVRGNSQRHDTLMASFGTKRWGVVFADQPPVKEEEVEAAENQILQKEAGEFEMFDEEAGFSESRNRRISRSRAFQRRVRLAYGNRCAVCGFGLIHPKGFSETEAAHIVPRSLKGSDDTRNGLLLCKAHHWAFDLGMIGVSPEYSILIPAEVGQIVENASLIELADATINLPEDQNVHPNQEALQWHLENILIH